MNSSGFYQKSNQSQLSQLQPSQSTQITLDAKYFLKSLKAKHEEYNLYKGIDIHKVKWVHIYAKQAESNYPLSNKIKENLRNQISPKIIWTGEVKIDKGRYYFEVHEKYGPSLQTMFEQVKSPITEKQLLHLLFQLIKLVQRIWNIKLVSGQMDPNLIVFDANPKKNELYLLNSFSLKKRNESIKPMHTKFCSRGAHLGRNLSIKDDLESICYILINIYTCGNFLIDKLPYQYQEEKLSTKILSFAKGLPKIFIDFYNYTIGLNYNDQINFFHWKTYLSKILTTELLSMPYGFLLQKESKPSIDNENQGIISLDDQLQMKEKDDEKQNTIEKVNRKLLNDIKQKLQL